ncbi:MAG: cobalamin synthesis protein P47K [Candidatus Hydrogenedentes bacterium]|nr:cobalamin synthesis protein P47K [Candidatus Hydrogenedentota bacterium]
MRLIVVGGFLGAGKTTLLAEAARRLARRGHSVGLITNDQVPDLVDTAVLTHTGAAVREVAGSCFCCNFKGFLDAVRSLEETGADCIVAEPVGSCTDLSATILQPLKEKYPQYALAPLSVLVDPQRVRAVFQNERSMLDPDAAYILRVQLEEADQVALSKCDTLSDAERDVMLAYLRQEFPHAPARALSTRSGDGIDAWIDDMCRESKSGTRVVNVDYDRYAHGEAVLGWLNAVASLRWIGGLEPDWKEFVNGLFAELQRELREKRCEVGHVKALLDTTDGRIAANLTGLNNAFDANADGALSRLNATLIMNARVQIAPDGIDVIFRDALKRASYARVAPTITAFHCISPGRPVPTYRYGNVVG